MITILCLLSFLVGFLYGTFKMQVYLYKKYDLKSIDKLNESASSN